MMRCTQRLKYLSSFSGSGVIAEEVSSRATWVAHEGVEGRLGIFIKIHVFVETVFT